MAQSGSGVRAVTGQLLLAPCGWDTYLPGLQMQSPILSTALAPPPQLLCTLRSVTGEPQSIIFPQTRALAKKNDSLVWQGQAGSYRYTMHKPSFLQGWAS